MGSTIALWAGASGDNYYFPVYVVAILIVAKGIPHLAPRVRACVLAFSGLSLVAISLVYLTGTAGRMTLDVNRVQVREIEESLAAAPRPKLVIDAFFALPWISGDPEQPVFGFVIDYQSRPKSIPGSMSLGREIAKTGFTRRSRHRTRLPRTSIFIGTEWKNRSTIIKSGHG